MTVTVIPGEPSIPPPAAAQLDLTPEAEARIHAALLRLVWLAFYVAFMRLLGYRIRRPARPNRATPPRRQTAASRPAPAQPRRQHRYIDREACAALLAGINQQVAAANPQPPAACGPAAPSPLAPPPMPRAPRQACPRARQTPQPRRHPAPIPPILRHPPPGAKNRLTAAAPSHALFVTLT
jgi:hypothetical protein